MAASLRRRLLVPTALLGLVVAAALGYLAWVSSVQGRALERSADEVRVATALAFALTDAAHEEDRRILSFGAPRTGGDEGRVAEVEARLAGLVREVGELELEPRAAAVWEQFIDTRAALRLIREEIVAASRRGDGPELALALQKWRLLSGRGSALLGNFTAYHLRLLDRTVADLHRRRTGVLRTAAGALVLGVLGAAAFAAALGRAVVGPIVDMARAAADVTESGPLAPVPGAQRRDEVGVLARSMNGMAARLVEAVRARDDFISIASHELKTPLTPLQLRLQRLLRLAGSGGGPLAREDVARATKDLERHVARFSKLVENLLDVSRISSGRLALRVEEIDVTRVVHDAVERVGDELLSAGCDLRLECAPGLHVRADRVRLEQVFVNLLTNVAKYAPGAPAVVRCALDGGAVRVVVEDGGAGVPPEHRERIFSRFERGVHDSHAVSGLGLGLFIAREIVRAHGGDLTVDGPPSGGASFVVRLPAEPSPGGGARA